MSLTSLAAIIATVFELLERARSTNVVAGRDHHGLECEQCTYQFLDNVQATLLRYREVTEPRASAPAVISFKSLPALCSAGTGVVAWRLAYLQLRGTKTGAASISED